MRDLLELLMQQSTQTITVGTAPEGQQRSDLMTLPLYFAHTFLNSKMAVADQISQEAEQVCD